MQCLEIKIKVLRSYGLGGNNQSIYEQIVEYLENNDGKMPQSSYSKDGKNLKKEELTVEQQEERKLYSRWYYSEERKILDEYTGRPLEQVPEEYREKIKVLRTYGLGLKEKSVYEQIVEWLETHESQSLYSMIYKRTDGNIEQRGRNLYQRWLKCEEKRILEEYKGRTLEEVPEEYREKIKVLRTYGLGLKEKTVYEKIIEWLETHDGNIPQSKFKKDGIQLRSEELTFEQQEEKKLYSRWYHSKVNSQTHSMWPPSP